jgi:hypothetical protein
LNLLDDDTEVALPIAVSGNALLVNNKITGDTPVLELRFWGV